MIKPSSNAPAPMQPWVRTTDKQIADLQNAIAKLQSMIVNPSQINHEQNNALSQTFDFVEQADGTIVANASDMNFTGSVNAESDFSINGELSVGNPSRVIFDQNTGEQIGVQPNVQILSGQFGVNPITQTDYFDAGQMNIYDTSLNVDAYGQITGDGLSIALTNDGQVERQNIAILGASGDGTTETFQIENNASNVAVYTAGRYVTITGVDPVDYNTPKSLITSVDTGVSPMTFTIDGTATDTYVGGGYVTINQANSIYEGKLSVQGPGPNYNGTTVNQNGVFVGLNAGDSASATSYMNQTEVASPSAVITGTRVFVSNSQPTAVSDGDLWIDSSGKVPLTANDVPVNYFAANFMINGGLDIWQRGTSFSSLVSTTGTIGTVSGTGPFTATITAMSSTANLQVGTQIYATAGTGNFGSGIMTVASIVSTTSITVTSTATFTAGTVTNIRGALYTADRFTAGSTVGTVSTTRSTDIPSDSGTQYSISLAGTSTTNPFIRQRIEAQNAIEFAGKTVTLSFYAKSTAGTGPIKVNTAFPTTTADTFTAFTADKTGLAVSPSGNALSSWTRYSVTFDVSASASRGYQIEIYRETTAASSTTLFTGIQLELGSSISPFARSGITIGQEFTLCYRYYYRHTPTGTAGTALSISVAGSSASAMPVFFPTPMRVTPISLDVNPTLSGNYAIQTATATTPTAAALQPNRSSTVCGSVLWSHPTITGGAAIELRGLTTAGYIGFSAEL